MLTYIEYVKCVGISACRCKQKMWKWKSKRFKLNFTYIKTSTLEIATAECQS